MIRGPQKTECSFCQIVQASPEESVVFSDEISLAFLDHRPLFPGHCLLIPRKHIETLLDMPDNLLGPFSANVRLLARAMETGLGADGSFVAANNRVSQSVPHFHVHIVPRKRKDGLRGFFWPRHQYKDAAEMMAVRDKLRAALARLR